MSNSNDEILTIEEAVKYLKIGKTTIYKLARTNKIPARKIGRKWRFVKSCLIEWVKENKEESETKVIHE